MSRCLLNLLAIGLLATYVMAQTTSSSVSRPPGSSSASSAVAASSGTSLTPALVFGTIPNMVTCGGGRFTWSLTGIDASTAKIDFFAVNIGVDQSPSAASSSSAITSSAAAATPLSSSSSLAVSRPITSADAIVFTSRSSSSTTAINAAALDARHQPDHFAVGLAKRADINLTIATDQPANAGYTWNSIKLPAGRYFIQGLVDNPQRTSARSGIFTVTAGTNSTCLQASSASGSSSNRASGTSSKSGSPSSTGAAAGAVASDTGSSGLPIGAIVGIVIAVILILAIVILGYLFYKRRQRQKARGAGYGNDPQMREGQFETLPSATTSQRGGVSDIVGGSGSTSNNGNGKGYGVGVGGVGGGYAMSQIRRVNDEDGGKNLLNERGGPASDGHGHGTTSHGYGHGRGLIEESYSELLYRQAPVHSSSAEADDSPSSPDKSGYNTPRNGATTAEREIPDPFATPLQGVTGTVPMQEYQTTSSQGVKEVLNPSSSDFGPSQSHRGIQSRLSISAISTSASASSTVTSKGDRPRQGSRSASGDATDTGRPGGGGSVGGMGRSTSLRRKPVPSLGAELRGQLKKEEQQMNQRTKASGGELPGVKGGQGVEAGPRMSKKYTLDVDMP